MKMSKRVGEGSVYSSYVAPKMLLHEFFVEDGFAVSIEDVGKDEEIDAF